MLAEKRQAHRTFINFNNCDHPEVSRSVVTTPNLKDEENLGPTFSFKTLKNYFPLISIVFIYFILLEQVPTIFVIAFILNRPPPFDG